VDVVLCRDLGGWAAAWDDLAATAGLPSPFLRTWWLEGTAGAGRRYLTVTEGDRLVGGMAVSQERWLGVRRFREPGPSALCPDHLDILALGGRGEEVVAALTGWFAQSGPSVLDVAGLAQSSQVSRLGPRGGPLVATVAGAPWVELTGEFSGYLAGRPAAVRNTVARVGRRLEREGIRYRRVAGPSPGGAASLERLVQLHASQWGSRSGFSSAAPAFVAAATAGMGRGEVSVHELAADDEVGASLVTFELSGRWSYYQAGRRLDHRWRGAGTVLLAQVIEAAFAAGATELDLLRGDEAYKPAWATRSRDVLRVRFGVGAAGRLALSSIEALDRARAAAGRAREGIGARIR